MKVVIDSGAKLPTRAHPTDAGLDLYCRETITLSPHSYWRFDTGVHVAIPNNCVGLLTSKSGLMTHGITCRGTIDCGYTGTLQPVIFNHSDSSYTFHAGDKLVQLVILPCRFDDIEVVHSLDGTERGSDGFGSTGK